MYPVLNFIEKAISIKCRDKSSPYFKRQSKSHDVVIRGGVFLRKLKKRPSLKINS